MAVDVERVVRDDGGLMTRLSYPLSFVLIATIGASCADAGEPSVGGLVGPSTDTVVSDLESADASVLPEAASEPDGAMPGDASVDSTPEEDAPEPPPPEPTDPIVEACTELFPPLCDKVAECALGPQISELLGPACAALISGASGVIDGLCEQAAGVIPGSDGFIGDLIASFLFPTIQQCIEEFACTPENIAYFAEGLGSLAGLLGGQGGGGFDFSSVNELIDLFTDCDEPPPAEPEPGDADATASDAGDAEPPPADADGDMGPADADAPAPEVFEDTLANDAASSLPDTPDTPDAPAGDSALDGSEDASEPGG